MARDQGLKVSSIHLRFLFPFEPGLADLFARFKKVMTIEINYSDTLGDPMITPENRRYSQLAWQLRARTLVDIECAGNVYGQPLGPGQVLEIIKKQLA